ncbi:MAG TPA: hypothetical protein VHE61_23560 [Opitutaceae bacterium]|nr:hypothetical protein [Opitutaceae bacterium]
MKLRSDLPTREPRQARSAAGRRLRWALPLLLAAAPLGFAADAQPPIELPPMIVSDVTGARPWHYASGPGIEVLARCDDDLAADFIRRNERLTQLLEYVLPARFRFRTTAPRIAILVESAGSPSLSQGLVEQFGGTDRKPDAAPAGATAVRILPNLELNDVDVDMVFGVIDPRTFNADRLVFAPEHIRYAIERRVPPLPAWFVEGLSRLLTQAEFTDDEVRFPEFPCASPEEAARLGADPDAPRPIGSLVDLFGAPPADPAALAHWQAEAELFARWCLEPGAPDRRPALWRFADAASRVGPSDALARECFQLGYAGLRDRLSDYLPEAIDHRIVLRPPVTRVPDVAVSTATYAQIGRIRGEWERLEIRFVQTRHPEFAPQYIQMARDTLRRARERVPTDTGVRVATALLDCDLGQRAAARPLLEAVFANPDELVRPRAYVELARMRLDDALAVARVHGELSRAQAAVALQALQRAISELPPLAEAYALTAEIWARSDAVLSDPQLALLSRALEEYPTNIRLLYYTAVLQVNRKDYDRALDLVRRGVAAAQGTPAQAQFVALRDALLKVRASPPAGK